MKLTNTGIINERDVTPQWTGGKGNNLGSYTFRAREFDEKLIGELAQDKLMRSALADFCNGQLNIRFGNKLAQERVTAELPKPNEGEKREAWLSRTEALAKEVAAEVLPGFEADYVSAFVTWALEDFANRGAKKDTRDILTNYDQLVAGIEARWDTTPVEARAEKLGKLGLDAKHATGTKEQAIAAIDAKYRRPVAVTVDDAF
jgi:hypothetical protein